MNTVKTHEVMGFPVYKRIKDPKFGDIEVIEGEHSVAMTNGKFGGWTRAIDGSYFQARNRAERRKGKRL